MDQLQTMQIYVQVVDSGSFTQAAEVLQLHRPTITKAVQQLERELGVRLLHRTTRKVSVTTEGGEFYQRCRRLLEDVNDTFSSFTSHAVVPTGRLRLDLPVISMERKVDDAGSFNMNFWLILYVLCTDGRTFPGLSLGLIRHALITRSA